MLHDIVCMQSYCVQNAEGLEAGAVCLVCVALHAACMQHRKQVCALERRFVA